MEQKLSEKIMKSVTKIIAQWEKDHPEDSFLVLAQQVNYSSLLLRTLGSELESEFKRDIKSKTTNDLH